MCNKMMEYGSRSCGLSPHADLRIIAIDTSNVFIDELQDLSLVVEPSTGSGMVFHVISSHPAESSQSIVARHKNGTLIGGIDWTRTCVQGELFQIEIPLGAEHVGTAVEPYNDWKLLLHLEGTRRNIDV